MIQITCTKLMRISIQALSLNKTEQYATGPMNIKENGFPQINLKEKFANQTEVYEDPSDLERHYHSNFEHKSMHSSPMHENLRGEENGNTQQPTFRSKSI